MPNDFWEGLDRLLAEGRIVIDRPKGSQHPRQPERVYPLDYGYLDGTSAGDGQGIDVWIGSTGWRELSALVLPAGLLKRDAEIKLLLGCTPEDRHQVLNFLNRISMRATLVARHKEKEHTHESHSRIAR